MMRWLLGGVLCLVALPAFAQTADPCGGAARTVLPISQTTNTKLVTAAAGKLTYVCSFAIVPADAENVSLVEGTGSTCGTNTAAVIGAATAAAGPNLGAKTPLVLGSGGSYIALGHTAVDLCLFQSASGVVAGVMTYVQR